MGARLLPHPARLFQLYSRGFTTQGEVLAFPFPGLLALLIVGFSLGVSNLFHLTHAPRCDVSPRRATTFVLIGSFIAARSKASAAIGPDTPSSSNRIRPGFTRARSEEHTSELQSLMRISYAVFCLKKKKKKRPDN